MASSIARPSGRSVTRPAESSPPGRPGTNVACPSLLLHRDPRAFPEPDAFRPQRFVDGVAVDAPYLPFGGGARRCLGEALAEAEFRAVLPQALARLRFTRAWPRQERMVVRHRAGSASQRAGPRAASTGYA
jgi:cytochrome P450 family 135